MRSTVRSFLFVFLAVSTYVMVGLAVGLPLGGRSTGYVSAMYPSAITPAGWAFSIWSLIYTGLGALAVWQALPGGRANGQMAQAAPWLMGAMVANNAWLLAWHYLYLPASMVIILTYTYCMARATDAFLIGGRPKGAAYWLGFGLCSLWAGWLTVATTANATVLLLSLDFDGGAYTQTWGVVVLTMAFLIAWWLFSRWRSAFYFGTIAWAFGAIAANQPLYPSVQMTAFGLGGLALLLAALQVARGRKQA